MHIFWARPASFCHLGFISDPLIVSKFHNQTHEPKGQENKIYTIVKGRETFYRRHTVPVTSCSEVKYVFKGVCSIKFDTVKSGWSIVYIEGLLGIMSEMFFLSLKFDFVLANFMGHFIWAFTVCDSTHLGVSSPQRVHFHLY